MNASKKRKAKRDDRTLLLFAKMGLSATLIAEELGVHPTTVKNRLNRYGLQTIDARRNFISNFVSMLPDDILDWLGDKITPSQPLPDYLYGLIVENYNRHKGQQKNEPQFRSTISGTDDPAFLER